MCIRDRVSTQSTWGQTQTRKLIRITSSRHLPLYPCLSRMKLVLSFLTLLSIITSQSQSTPSPPTSTTSSSIQSVADNDKSCSTLNHLLNHRREHHILEHVFRFSEEHILISPLPCPETTPCQQIICATSTSNVCCSHEFLLTKIERNWLAYKHRLTNLAFSTTIATLRRTLFEITFEAEEHLEYWSKAAKLWNNLTESFNPDKRASKNLSALTNANRNGRTATTPTTSPQSVTPKDDMNEFKNLMGAGNVSISNLTATAARSIEAPTTTQSCLNITNASRPERALCEMVQNALRTNSFKEVHEMLRGKISNYVRAKAQCFRHVLAHMATTFCLACAGDHDPLDRFLGLGGTVGFTRKTCERVMKDCGGYRSMRREALVIGFLLKGLMNFFDSVGVLPREQRIAKMRSGFDQHVEAMKRAIAADEEARLTFPEIIPCSRSDEECDFFLENVFKPWGIDETALLSLTPKSPDINLQNSSTGPSPLTSATAASSTANTSPNKAKNPSTSDDDYYFTGSNNTSNSSNGTVKESVTVAGPSAAMSKRRGKEIGNSTLGEQLLDPEERGAGFEELALQNKTANGSMVTTNGSVMATNSSSVSDGESSGVVSEKKRLMQSTQTRPKIDFVDRVSRSANGRPEVSCLKPEREEDSIRIGIITGLDLTIKDDPYVEAIDNLHTERLAFFMGWSISLFLLLNCLQTLSSYTITHIYTCLLYTSPSPRDGLLSRMPSSA
eukprot:TRINITY_DN9656_c0_g1_i1.p1 TRINITY_DN9656_c0_g1~~TRINITY_DN9656_c0_g1_i1.p1  ORF type:complete len:729 (+),score=122.26 TRINITY_DN9656_c0_g1_i1:66-2252(+)